MSFDFFTFCSGAILSLLIFGLLRLFESLSLLEKIFEILTKHNDNHGGSDDEQ